MNKKGAIKISEYLIGIILFSAMISGVVTIFATFVELDPTIIPNENFQEFARTFNKTSDIEESVGGIASNVEEANVDPELKDKDQGIIGSFISHTWGGLAIVGTSFAFMNGVWSGLTVWIPGFPVWVITMIGLIITVLIAFALISLIFGRDS